MIDSTKVMAQAMQVIEANPDAVMPFYYFILAALAGTVLHVMKKLAAKETEAGFNPMAWGKAHLFKTLSGAGLAVAAVFLMEEMGQLTIAAAFLAGYTGDSAMMKK